MFRRNQTPASTEAARRFTAAKTIPLCAVRDCGNEGERLLDANARDLRVCETHGEAYDSRTGQSS